MSKSSRNTCAFLALVGLFVSLSLTYGLGVLAQNSNTKITISEELKRERITVKEREPEREKERPRNLFARIVGFLFGASQEEKKEKEVERVTRIPLPPGKIAGPLSQRADAFGVTSPIRDLPEFKGVQKPVSGPVKIKEKENNEIRIERTIPGAGAGNKPFQDPSALKSRQTNQTNAPMAMPGPLLTFNGILSNDILNTFSTASLPPDTVGDVGPNHYVQATNIGVFRIFNKAGIPLNANTRISSLFSSLPISNKCRTTDDGDPIVLYDPLADRWIISQFGLTSLSGELFAPSYQCVAVSQTGDPTGAYYAYGFRAPNDYFLDYPHLSVWPDGYYMSSHEFTSPLTNYAEGGFWALNRAKMLVGDPTANYIYFGRTATAGHLPADFDGNVAPPANTPAMFFEYIADEFGGTTDELLSYEFVPDFNTPANSTLTAKPGVATMAFDPRTPGGSNIIEQPNPATTSQYLDALADRLLHRVAYRNLGSITSPSHSYVMNWTVNVSGELPSTPLVHQAGIRWTEMRRSAEGNMSIFDQGTHAPDPPSGTGRNRWMGSLAQDNQGNLALGFSRSGPSDFPSIVWAGRTGGMTAAGTMNEGETVMFASTGVQQSSSGRWGDYASMSVDPMDDCSFWFSTEWRDSAFNGTASNNEFKWSTRIGTFKFPSCTNAPKGTLALTVTECGSNNPVNGAVITVNPGGFMRRTQADGTLTSNIGLAPGTYSVTASFNGITATNNAVIITNGNTTNAALCLNGPLVVATTSSISLETCAATNGAIDPGEYVTVNLGLQNLVGTATSNLYATLQPTGGVAQAGEPQHYGVLTGGGAAVSRSFSFIADSSLLCGQSVVLTLALNDGSNHLGTVSYTLPTTTVAGTATTTSYTGPVVEIPDISDTGAVATLNVSGVNGLISDLNFRFDGTASTALGAGLDHTWVGDLTINLTSPAGTVVTLVGQMNSFLGANTGCSANHFFNITLDDESANGVIDAACGSGTNLPANLIRKSDTLLSTFDGENPNGVWTLKVYDSFGGDMGNIRAFSLIITPAACATCPPPPPLITANSPKNVSGCATSTINLGITASGTGLNYQWRKNSSPLANNGHFTNVTTNQLSISNAVTDDGGAYDCVVTNANGSATSAAIIVTVSQPSFAPATLSNGTAGFPYLGIGQQLIASNGVGPYNYSVISGTLPVGITLSDNGLLSGTPATAGTYNFTVRATDVLGCTVAQAYTLMIGDTLGGLQFYPLAAPVRLLDTRSGASPNACFQPNMPITGQTSRVQPGRNTCDIPVTAQALTGNITTVQSGGGYLTLYPSDVTQPSVANSNFTANQVLNNVFTVALANSGPNAGSFNIFATSNTEMVIDVTGYYAPPGVGGLYFHPLPAPLRLLDTRTTASAYTTPGAKLGANTDTLQAGRNLTYQGITIPAAAQALVGNATTVEPGDGFLTLYPQGQTRPFVASSNYNAGDIRNGPFTVGLGSTGEFVMYVTAYTHLVVDVLGYYSAEATDVNGVGLLFSPLPSPVRLLDTRMGATGCDQPKMPLAEGSTRTQLARNTCTIPATAQGLVGNTTTVNPLNNGYLTFFPGSVLTPPLVATSNYTTGQVFNRHFLVGLGNGDGAFKIYTSATTDLVVDVSGYFAP